MQRYISTSWYYLTGLKKSKSAPLSAWRTLSWKILL
jgi:hypothetical protein